MKRIVVLGAGMVGRAIAYDLSKKYNVTSVDISEESLRKVARIDNIKTQQADVSDNQVLKEILNDVDLVVSAVPGFLGFQVLKTIIECRKNFVDISFLPEDALILNQYAQQQGICGIVDMGIAPGVPNMVAGYYYKQMKIESFEYMVGGLPKIRTMPFQYKAPFSPVDVIEEYTRAARHKINGKIVILPAMSDAEYVHFENIGTLEAFNTDGLRSLLVTLPNIKNMKEKTLRYPGHIALVKALIDSGFMSQKPINVKGQQVVPFDVTTNILFENWRLADDEPEFTVMKIIIHGQNKTIIVDVYDEYDANSKLSSMARTTGFTATAGVELIMNGMFTKAGVFPPELIVQTEGCYEYVIKHLKERAIKISTVEKTL